MRNNAPDGGSRPLTAAKVVAALIATVIVGSAPALADDDLAGSPTSVPRFLDQGAAVAVSEALPSALPSFMSAPGALDGMRDRLEQAGEGPVATAPSERARDLSTVDFQATLTQARRDAGEARALADELGARAAELSRRLDEDVPLATLRPVAAEEAPAPVVVQVPAPVEAPDVKVPPDHGGGTFVEDDTAAPVTSPIRKPDARPDRPVVRTKMARGERQQRRARPEAIAAAKPARDPQRVAKQPAVADPAAAAEAPAKGLFSWFKPFKLPGEMTAFGWADKSSDNLP